MPSKFSHKPPEAKTWEIMVNLAPPVPKKVIIFSGELLPSMANVTIRYRGTFYNRRRKL
ncbi:unnamed protein product [marine sediment metagenome]|uniref:Uncharacterized protein n=1 Tax=marine sediment metagenome TaxID=412755 RepID=X1VW18_9ZZZZ